MFKYLWIVFIVAVYALWVFKAIKGFIEEIKFAKRHHERFNLDYLPVVTVLYIVVHAIAILVLSAIEFCFYYSK